MKKHNTIPAAFICAIAAAALLAVSNVSCTGPQAVNGGGGTGVGNAAVSGRVLHNDNSPVAGAVVRVRPDSYVQDTTRMTAQPQPGRIIDCITDSTGTFRIDSLDTGAFCIEVIDTCDSALGTLIKIDSRDTGRMVLQPRVVTPVTKLTGTIMLYGLPQNAWVQIYGLEAIGKTDARGRFEITELPLGDCEQNECEYKLRILRIINGVLVAADYEMELEWKNGVMTVEIELEDEREDESDD